MIHEITHAVSCAGSDSYVKVIYNDDNNVFAVEIHDGETDYNDLIAVSMKDMEKLCLETLDTIHTISKEAEE